MERRRRYAASSLARIGVKEDYMQKKITVLCITMLLSLISVGKGEATPTELEFTAQVSRV